MPICANLFPLLQFVFVFLCVSARERGWGTSEREADDEGEVIAEAGLVAVAVEGAERLHAPHLLVGFEQEGGIVNGRRGDAGMERGRYEHMVDLFPASLVSVVGRRTVEAHGLRRGTLQALRKDETQGMVVERGVEVACNEDVG